MSSLISYLNPISHEHHALDRFKTLTPGKQGATIALTVLAALVSLPILGLGGVAAFRALTQKFSKLDLTLEESGPKLPLQKSAEKTQYKYIQVFKEFYRDSKFQKKQTYEVVDVRPYESLETEKDTIFHLLAQKKNITDAKVVNDMKEFIKNKPKKIEKIYTNFDYKLDFLKGFNLTLDSFKQFLVNENVSKTLLENCGKNEEKLEYYSVFQKALNMVRAELLSQIYDTQINMHSLFIHDWKDQEEGTFPQDFPGMNLITGDVEEYGRSKDSIDFVLGSIEEEGNSLTNYIFLQPRLLKKAEE